MDSNKEKSSGNQFTNSFFAYNFGGLEKLRPKEQIEMLYKYGYDGICLRMAKEEHVDQLPEFIKTSNTKANFKIYSVFIRYNFADSEKDKNRWKEVIDLIGNQGIDLWVIFGKKEPYVDDTHVESVLREILSYSESKNVPVTLYPHSWCYFETSEDALSMVQKIDHPNLKLAIHTCHELKAGNGDRLQQVVENVKDHISFVTIAGAQNVVDMTSRKTMDQTSILPLEDGTFDLGPFLKALNKINYKGPVGYINFGFNKPPETYLPLSLAEWDNLYIKYLK